MSRVRGIKLVAGREIRERTRSRSFRLTTALMALGIVAAVIVPGLLNRGDDRDSTLYRVGFVEPTSESLRTAIGRTNVGGDAAILTVTYPNEGAAEDALRNDELELLIVPGEAVKSHLPLTEVNPLARLAQDIVEVERRYTGLVEAGLTAEQLSTALEAEPLPITAIETETARNLSGAQASTAGMILLFVFLTLYGAFILNGVIEEKTSRVVEILLATVRPGDLLLGKVLGIGAVGTIQGVVLVAVTLLSQTFSADGGATSSMTPEVVAYCLLWFLIGFGIYAGLFACAGALVSRAEDAQNLVFPLQLPLIASYIVGLTGAIGGPNLVLNVMSFIPFTAPMTMLERMAAEQVQWWEVLISVGISLVTMVLIMRLAAVVFAGGILRSGQRIKVRDAWRNSAA